VQTQHWEAWQRHARQEPMRCARTACSQVPACAWTAAAPCVLDHCWRMSGGGAAGLHRGTRCYCKLAEAPFAIDSQLRLSSMCHISDVIFVVLSHAVLALKHALRCAVFPGALWDHARKCHGHGGKHKLPAVMHHVLQISVHVPGMISSRVCWL
jgi:hypothetical protein